MISKWFKIEPWREFFLTQKLYTKYEKKAGCKLGQIIWFSKLSWKARAGSSKFFQKGTLFDSKAGTFSQAIKNSHNVRQQFFKIFSIWPVIWQRHKIAISLSELNKRDNNTITWKNWRGKLDITQQEYSCIGEHKPTKDGEWRDEKEKNCFENI